MMRKPKALALCFFPAFTPPSSGGEMRLGGLYREFSRHYDITLLTSTDFGARFEEIRHAPDFRELRFPKDAHWRQAYATLEASGLQGDLSGLAFALATSEPECALRRMARELADDCALIIHDFPYSEPIFADGAPAPEIYNAHNVEAGLLSSIAGGAGFESAWLKLLRLEGNLIRRAQKIFATSAADAEIFRLLYGADPKNLFLCPNGYDEDEIGEIAEARQAGQGENAPKGRPPTLLFTGSGHHPNVEAAVSLLALARYMPDCHFVVAGGVCKAIETRERPDNVELFGPFTPKQKQHLLREADLYINPVVLGSGTSLKAVEALAACLPMVSTAEGVRGLDLAPDEHALIVQREEFVLAIRRALKDSTLRAHVAQGGRRIAQERFSWRAIADRLAQKLATSVAPPRASRPLVLAFNDYALSGVKSGGASRVANLLGALDCDVALLTFADKTGVALLDNGLLQIEIARTPEHRAFAEAVNGTQAVSANDIVAALFCAGNRTLRDLSGALALRAQAVVFEHPYMAPMLDGLRDVRSDLPVVYSAHNVETDLKRKLLRQHPLARILLPLVHELERGLVASADLVVCCTAEDHADFASMTDRSVVVAANGCRLPPDERAAKLGGGPKVGFLGSAHGPNAIAADYIVRALAPKFPYVRFELIGDVCTALTTPPPGNVVLHGAAPDRMKSFLMRQWDLALNPVASGGGSSLKLPDYMAHGLATLNTHEGARGFAVAEHGAGRVVALDDFPDQLARMLENGAVLAEAGARARSYAESELSWAAAASDYRAALSTLLRSPPARAPRKLLVVTYRYTEPALGGAEEYLVEVLQRLRGRFDRIDLAAMDVERIENRHHFGCDLSDGPGAAGRIGELFDSAVFFPIEELGDAEMLERARELERIWASEEFHLLAPFAKTLADSRSPRLLSGFFGPEGQDGAIVRWTAPDFSFLLPDDARQFRIKGYATQDKTLSIILLLAPRDGSPIVSLNCETLISTHFTEHFALPRAPTDCVRILLCRVDEHHAPGDHRPFGALVQEVSVLSGDSDAFAPLETHWADLGFEPAELLRSKQFEAWVSALHKVAMRREPQIDAAFASVRGPHSQAMRQWLAAHGGDYDVVLAQGVPFDVVPAAVETLTAVKPRPRIVTLPHFHGDDRFYHWRTYFDAFARADRTLLFSPSLADRLGEAVSFAVVPGGGVRIEDACGLGAIESFRAVCPAPKPFFLVLGRKTGSKGYADILKAQNLLRESRKDIDLVMIGPDEDGAPVEAPGLHYLGRQSRDVVRGALARCLGLVTMSRSESFGIVVCEAWLFGKPVIANAQCYAFRDLVRDGETGRLVSGVAELAQAMAELADDPEARLRMGEAGFAEAIETYSWETSARAIDSEL